MSLTSLNQGIYTLVSWLTFTLSSTTGNTFEHLHVSGVLSIKIQPQVKGHMRNKGCLWKWRKEAECELEGFRIFCLTEENGVFPTSPSTGMEIHYTSSLWRMLREAIQRGHQGWIQISLNTALLLSCSNHSKQIFLHSKKKNILVANDCYSTGKVQYPACGRTQFIFHDGFA